MIVEFLKKIYDFILAHGMGVIAITCVIAITIDLILSIIIINKNLKTNKNIPLAKAIEEEYHFQEIKENDDDVTNDSTIDF